MKRRKKIRPIEQEDDAKPLPTKRERLRKKLIVHGVVVASVIVVLFVVHWVVASGVEEVTRQRNSLRAQTQQIRGQAGLLEEKIESSGRSAELYIELDNQRKNMAFEIDRRKLKSQINSLRERYRIFRMEAKVSPAEPYKPDALKAVNREAVKVQVEVNMGGISDRHLLSLVHEMEQILPGFMQVDYLSLGRENPLNYDALEKIKRGEVEMLVRGILRFTWYGFERGSGKTREDDT